MNSDKMSSKNKSKSTDQYTVPAIVQAANVLFALADSNSSHLGVPDICSKTGLHSSRVYSILHTLQQFGFTQKNVGGKGYSLGPGLLPLSRNVLDNLDISQLSKPILEDLAKEADNIAALALIVNDQLLIVAKHEGSRNELNIAVHIGRTFPISHSAEGKAIAAFLPEDELRKLLRRKNLYFQNKSGEINRERLLHDLEECRKQGYALDHGEVNQRFNSVASPVFGPMGTPIGCITIIGIPEFEQARKIGPKIAEAGKNLSRLLGANNHS